MENKKNWLYVVVIVVIIAAIVAWMYLYQKNAYGPIDKPNPAPSKASSPAISGTLPSVSTAADALENVPEINPAKKANPFKNVYSNPFE